MLFVYIHVCAHMCCLLGKNRERTLSQPSPSPTLSTTRNYSYIQKNIGGKNANNDNVVIMQFSPVVWIWAPSSGCLQPVIFDRRRCWCGNCGGSDVLNNRQSLPCGMVHAQHLLSTLRFFCRLFHHGRLDKRPPSKSLLTFTFADNYINNKK